MTIGDLYKDSEGNCFAITEQHSGFIWLRNRRGDLKQIGKEELRFYKLLEMNAKQADYISEWDEYIKPLMAIALSFDKDKKKYMEVLSKIDKIQSELFKIVKEGAKLI